MKNYAYDEMKMQPTGRTITVQLYTLDELCENAREYAYREWLDCMLPYDIEDQLEISVDYDARKALESVGADYDCDSYGRLYPIMRGIEIPRTGHGERMEDFGDCISMDVAQAYNAHGPQLEAYASMWYQVAYPENGSPFYACSDEVSYNLLSLYESMYLAEFEKAVQSALNAWTEARETERDYLSSREAFEDESYQGGEWRSIDVTGRVYYSDNRRWYTVDGEEFEQSDINHECVSLARVS